MPLITSSRLLNTETEYGAYIQYGTVLDDVTDVIIPNLTVIWTPVEDLVDPAFAYSAHTVTDSNGMFHVLITSIHGEATYEPTIPGYKVTGWTGGPVRTNRPVNTFTGSPSVASITVRANKLPQSMSLTASGTTFGTHESEEWINDTPLYLIPAFTTSAPVPTGARYLYGIEDWTKSQIEASGTDWTTGTVSQSLTTIARADRYFNIVSIVDGISGVTTSEVTKHHIKYDATAPPQSGIADISGVTHQSIYVKASGISDGLSGTEVKYKFTNATSGFTSAYASGQQFIEDGLTENTTYRVGITTKDAAGNESSIKLSDPKEAAITFVKNPQPSDIKIGWFTETSTVGTVKMESREFTNRGIDSAATRYRVWEGRIDPPPITDAGKENSDWIDKSDYKFSNIDPSTLYTFGLTYRNQVADETVTLLTEKRMDQQDLTQLQIPSFTHLPTINIPAEKSPSVRWGMKLEKIDTIQTQYRRGGVYRSKPHILREPAYQVRLVADVEIPSTFPGGDWIKFYISPDEGNTVFPIDPMNMGPNTILAFNSAMTNNEKSIAELLGWSFVQLHEAPTKLTVVIDISRPLGETFGSPLVYSYDLRVAGISKLHRNPLERGVAPQAKR